MRLAGVAAALPLLLALGCASAMPETPGARRSADIEELKARVLELSRQATVNEVELSRLRQQVAALEARLGISGRPAQALPARERPAQERPARPAGQPAPAGRPPARAAAPAPPAVEEDDLAAEELDLGAPAPETASALQPVPRDAQAIYDDAYTLYHQGRYEQAEQRFTEFLAASPRTELSDNAQYWIGAARFARGDFRGALAAFRITVERYPGDNKIPDALFKMGQALEQLGEAGEARTVYRDLVQRFPDTAAATLASERLDTLR